MTGDKTTKMTLTAVFAALIFLFTFLVKLPVASGYIHLGDTLIYLFATIVGFPWALLAGAIGEGLADLAGGFAIYAPATVLIKALVAVPFLFFTKKSNHILNLWTGLMTIPAGLITVGGYFLADLVIDKAYAMVDIPGNVVQALGSAVLFLVLGFAFDKMNLKEQLLRGFVRTNSKKHR